MKTRLPAAVMLCTALALFAAASSTLAQPANPPGIIVAPPEQTVPERQGVLDRARPDYDQLGIRLGSFLVFPTGQLAESYDTNVFATTTNTKSDFYTTLNPSIALRSDWNVHALDLEASSQTKRYAGLVSENVTNFAVSGGGRLDIQRDIYASASAEYQLLHEDRSSPDSVNGKNPVEYHITSARLAYVHEPGRLGARIDTTVDSYSFNNATTSAGATINQHSRDRIVYALGPRVSYEIIPGYHAFAKASGNERDYVQKFDNQGVQRSSRGYEVDGGTAIDITELINGEIFAGYLSQTYDDSRLKPASGFDFGGNVLWNVTPLTSLRATLSRTIEETTQFASVGGVTTSASGYFQTTIKLTAEHELLRNLLLSASLGYSNSDYQGINRNDDEYDAAVVGRYLINRNLSATADFSVHRRSSNVAGASFDRGVGILALKAGF